MSNTVWGVYPVQGKLPDGNTVAANDKRATKWLVRWRVDGTLRKRTLMQKGHAKTFRDRLVLAQLLSQPADNRGYPLDPEQQGDGSSLTPPGTSQSGLGTDTQAASLRSRSFQEYCNDVWWPTMTEVFNPRNRTGHRKNMQDAIKWLRYRIGDPRIGTRPNTEVGDSILLVHLNSDDVKHALIRRRNTNDRTVAVYQRKLARIDATSDGADVELTPERASDRTVTAFKVTLGMIVKAADDSNQADQKCLRGTSSLAPRPSPETAARRIVPSISDVFAISEAIASIGPVMDDGKPAGERFRALVLAGGTLGPRPGELTAHRPDWFRVEDGITFIKFAATEGSHYDRQAGIRGRVQTGLKHRSEGEERWVPALSAVATALMQHTAAGYGLADRTFASATGRAGLDWHNMLANYWYPACHAVFADSDKPSLVNMPPKTLRRAAVTFWLDSGVRPSLAAHWAGHSEEVANRYYAGRTSPGFALEATMLAQQAERLMNGD